MSVVGDVIDSVTGGGVEDASKDAADASVAAQREALEYLKEREELPTQFREGALTKLAGIYGLPGGEGSQQQILDMAQASPYYRERMRTGEEAILRNQSATGRLRSGSTQAAVAENADRILSDAYDRQLLGLGQMGDLSQNVNQIAASMAGIGETKAQGIIGAEQSRQDAFGNLVNIGFGIGSLLL